MSHGKKAYLKGTTKTLIEIPAPGKALKFDFADEEELGIVPTHGKVSGDQAKAKKSIVAGVNQKLAKKWKDLKAPGKPPTLGESDLKFEVYTAK
jgi:hypothetical protein